MKIKTTIISLMLLLGMIGLNKNVEAHGVGPHGGKTVDMDIYDLEYKVVTGMVHLYIIDEKGQTVPPTGATGKLSIQVKDGPRYDDIVLSVMNDALMAITKLDDKTAFTANALIQLQGKTYAAHISYTPEK